MNKTVILESVIISKVPSIQDMTTEIRVELTTTIDILPNVYIMDILCKSFFNNPDIKRSTSSFFLCIRR